MPTAIKSASTKPAEPAARAFARLARNHPPNHSSARYAATALVTLRVTEEDYFPNLLASGSQSRPSATGITPT